MEACILHVIHIFKIIIVKIIRHVRSQKKKLILIIERKTEVKLRAVLWFFEYQHYDKFVDHYIFFLSQF